MQIHHPRRRRKKHTNPSSSTQMSHASRDDIFHWIPGTSPRMTAIRDSRQRRGSRVYTGHSSTEVDVSGKVV